LGILRRAEKNDILSSSQNEFQKGRGTRDCLALLTTDVQTSLETKQHTVAAFIDIFGAYDIALIETVCNILMDKELPSKIVRFLARLLWRNVLVIFTGGREYMTLAGYKDLPQGSVLSYTISLGLAQINLSQPAVAFSINMLTIWWCMLLIG
jgi:hypothetical protein